MQPHVGQECYELVYDAKLINLPEFRIARLYTPGGEEQAGCTSPAEQEAQDLIKHFEDSVIRRLESGSDAKAGCPEGYRCVYNGRFSEWSEWMGYPDETIEVITRTSRGTTVCKWKLRGTVKVRYKKRLGDCFKTKLFE